MPSRSRVLTVRASTGARSPVYLAAYGRHVVLARAATKMLRRAACTPRCARPASLSLPCRIRWLHNTALRTLAWTVDQLVARRIATTAASSLRCS